ncbi:MAG: hypothetical protein EOP83_13430 [Verrucomicrobiaceae bacterium]|nr:MAG: hypothetical protein EOP83_13430 [Verrucomicrobiaceae bacterium]
MSKPPREPKLTPYTDRNGQAFKLAKSERMQPVRRAYTINDRAVFEDVSRALIGNDAVRGMLMEVFKMGVDGRRMRKDEAMELMVEGVAHVRSELSRQDVATYVHEVVPRLLSETATARLRTKGKTARDLTRAARIEAVKSLKAYRR